jgi:hypothetical protein
LPVAEAKDLFGCDVAGGHRHYDRP